MIHASMQHFSNARVGIRRVALQAGLAAAFAGFSMASLAQTAVDEALLTIERPAMFYSQMPRIAGAMNSPALEVADKRKIPALTQQGEKLARVAFDETKTMADIRAALAKTPDAGAVGKDLPAIAARFREHEAVLDAMSAEQAQAAGAKYDAQLNARADKAAIQKVSSLMAGPVLAGEHMVTAKRFKRIYEAIILGNNEKLRAMSPAEVEQGAREILQMSRDPKEDQPGPFMHQVMMDSWRLRKQAVMTQLSKADVAALQAFYASPAGRAKRAALVDTFVASNDKAATQVIKGLMADLQ